MTPAADGARLRRALAPWAHALSSVTPRDRVLVACSGGTDSLALLALACGAGLDVVAVHVDHGVRLGGEHEAELVTATATALGARGVRRRVTVAAGPNLEARARHARYDALERARRDMGAEVVLVGHTADDLAETVLLNLLRGSATSGLAGLPPTRDRIVRPLLSLRRADTAEICARLGLAPVHDPMNDDVRHRRVWLRREVIPFLEAGAARDLRSLLVRQAAVLREEAELLDALADDALRDAGDPPSVAVLAALPRALARRAVRRWLGAPPPSLAHVDATLEVVRGARRATEISGGRRVERRGGRVHLVDSGADPSRGPADPGPVALPGRTERGRLVVDAWVERVPPAWWPDGRSVCVLDADRVGPDARLRRAAPGDRLQPLGLRGTKSVASLLAESGVARGDRAHAPVLVAGERASVPEGSVVWVVGYRVDHRVRVTTRTRRFLWISAEETPR